MCSCRKNDQIELKKGNFWLSSVEFQVQSECEETEIKLFPKLIAEKQYAVFSWV